MTRAMQKYLQIPLDKHQVGIRRGIRWVQVDIPKGYSSEKFLFRKVFILKGHYSEKFDLEELLHLVLKSFYPEESLFQNSE